MRQEQRVVVLTILGNVDGLQVLLEPLSVLFAPDVDVGGLVLVKQVVQLVVGRLHGVHLLLLVVLDRRMVVAVRWVVHHYVLVANVGRALLVALVVAECHRHLVHVQGPVQVVQRVLLKVLVRYWVHVYVHFHCWVTAIVH